MQRYLLALLLILTLGCSLGFACSCRHPHGSVYADQAEVAFTANVVSTRVDRIWLELGVEPDEDLGYKKSPTVRPDKSAGVVPWERLEIVVEVTKSWKQQPPRYVTMHDSQACNLMTVRPYNTYLFLGEFRDDQFVMDFCGGFFPMFGHGETRGEVVGALGGPDFFFKDSIVGEAVEEIAESEVREFRQRF